MLNRRRSPFVIIAHKIDALRADSPGRDGLREEIGARVIGACVAAKEIFQRIIHAGGRQNDMMWLEEYHSAILTNSPIPNYAGESARARIVQNEQSGPL